VGDGVKIRFASASGYGSVQRFSAIFTPQPVSKCQYGTIELLGYALIVYSALVLFVWLNVAFHAADCLPCKFYPWVWLTE
jgi:hypothetical protein